VLNKPINKILIIRLSSLGDILLTTPIIRAVKEKYPSANIDFTVRNQYKDALIRNPNISNLIIYENGNAGQIKSDLKTAGYDLIIDLQNNIKSRKLIAGLKAEVRRFNKPSLKKILLVKFKINLLKNLVTIPERYASAAGVNIDGKSPELILHKGIKSNLEKGSNYIGFCPGSKHFTKRWPAEYFIDLGNKLVKKGSIVVLFGGRDDAELCQAIAEKIPGSINLQNDNALLQTASDMKECKLIVTNDSGLMHTASAVGIPIVAIFGSTVREFGFIPSGTQNLILENNSLSCRPCSHIGKAICPKKHFKCMNELTAGFVLGQIQKFQRGL